MPEVAKSCLTQMPEVANICHMTFNGEALRTLRKALGWRGSALASAVGISPSHLSHIERGDRGPNPNVARKIADTLGVPLAALVCPHGMDAAA